MRRPTRTKMGSVPSCLSIQYPTRLPPRVVTRMISPISENRARYAPPFPGSITGDLTRRREYSIGPPRTVHSCVAASARSLTQTSDRWRRGASPRTSLSENWLTGRLPVLLGGAYCSAAPSPEPSERGYSVPLARCARGSLRLHRRGGNRAIGFGPIVGARAGHRGDRVGAHVALGPRGSLDRAETARED